MRPPSTQRRTVPGETPARAATCASVSSSAAAVVWSPGSATQAREATDGPMRASLRTPGGCAPRPAATAGERGDVESPAMPAGTAIHLRPTAPLAERVLLPGDPGRALALAQSLLEGPRMFNHHRGLWGYTGTAPDGLPLTIQATGMGGPSAAIVLAELIALGARRAIRVGSCG